MSKQNVVSKKLSETELQSKKDDLILTVWKEHNYGERASILRSERMKAISKEMKENRASAKLIRALYEQWMKEGADTRKEITKLDVNMQANNNEIDRKTEDIDPKISETSKMVRYYNKVKVPAKYVAIDMPIVPTDVSEEDRKELAGLGK